MLAYDNTSCLDLCSSAQENLTANAFCIGLRIDDCNTVDATCVQEGSITPTVPLFPPAANDIASGSTALHCAVSVVVGVTLTPPQDNALFGIRVLQTILQIPNYSVTGPAAAPSQKMATSSILGINVSSSSSSLGFTDQSVQYGISSGLALPVNEVLIVGDTVVYNATMPPQASSSSCSSPQLGSLCGSDAIGAIVGIALASAIFLTLAIWYLYELFKPTENEIAKRKPFSPQGVAKTEAQGAWVYKHGSILQTNAHPPLHYFGLSRGVPIAPYIVPSSLASPPPAAGAKVTSSPLPQITKMNLPPLPPDYYYHGLALQELKRHQAGLGAVPPPPAIPAPPLPSDPASTPPLPLQLPTSQDIPMLPPQQYPQLPPPTSLTQLPPNYHPQGLNLYPDVQSGSTNPPIQGPESMRRKR